VDCVCTSDLVCSCLTEAELLDFACFHQQGQLGPTFLQFVVLNAMDVVDVNELCLEFVEGFQHTLPQKLCRIVSPLFSISVIAATLRAKNNFVPIVKAVEIRSQLLFTVVIQLSCVPEVTAFLQYFIEKIIAVLVS